MQEAYRISIRRGCRLLMQSRKVYHWQSRRDDRAITFRIRDIAGTRIRYGCPRIHIQLRREGFETLLDNASDLDNDGVIRLDAVLSGYWPIFIKCGCHRAIFQSSV